MSDLIKKDDEKFDDLITKQYPEGKLIKSEPSDDQIENDDAKMEDYLYLQAISEADEEVFNSVEEKYEIKILTEKFVGAMLEAYPELKNGGDIDGFEAGK